MKRLVLGFALILAGCNQAPDGYVFEKAEFERRTQPVTVIEHSTLTALRDAAPKEALQANRDLMGFSYLRPTGCEIHVTILKGGEARAWLGHEMTHCVYGRWHP